MKKFPELAICIGVIRSVRGEKDNYRIEELRKKAHARVRQRYDAATLKDNVTVRAYRDFYWQLKIDPTKIRPSGEALLRRVVNGSDLPKISNVVDAYNLASMETIIPISGFDFDRLEPPFQVRFAADGEAFTGLGMKTPMLLTSEMLVLADARQILCVYPYRDSDSTEITAETQNAATFAYGAPGISASQLQKAVETALEYIRQVSGGQIWSVNVFKCGSA